jgi:hypothetical protein
LEQNLGAHTEETIDNPEGEDHWHTINEPVITMLTELQLLMGKNALTDSRTMEVFMNRWQTPLNEGFEHPLIQQGAMHGRAVIPR